MRTAGLHDVLEIHALLREGITQQFHTGQGHFNRELVRCNVHRRRIRIVAALALVHIVVRVQHLLLIGELAAVQHVCPIGHHFIHVHVALGAAAGLPDHQGELIVQRTGKDLIAHITNEVALFLGKLAELQIGKRRSLLQVRERMHDLQRHAARRPDLEIVAAALRLRAPVLVGGDLHLAHGVLFDTVVHVKIQLSSLKIQGPVVKVLVLPDHVHFET